MNIFEQASRKSLRFETVRGAVQTEHLWDIPLTSRTGYDLDTIAKAANADLKSQTEESFVATKTNPAKNMAELRLEIVKYVIADRIADQDKKALQAQRKVEREKLINLLGQKQDEQLLALTPEQIQAKLAELTD